MTRREPEQTNEPFTLTDRKQHRPKPVIPNNPATQTVLFTGLSCLPGQQELLSTDGPKETQDDRLQRHQK